MSLGKALLPPNDRRIWLDGELVPWDDVTVHVLSHSMQRASLIFDFMSVHDTPRGPAVFRMPEHVRRLLRSAELLGLPLARGEAELCDAIVAAVRANPGATCAKICAYLPSIEVEVVPMDARMAVCVAAYDASRDVIARSPGTPHVAPELRLHLDPRHQKMRPEILPPAAKVSANYASPMVAKWAARRAGYDEILLLDEKGFVAEASTENVFLVDRDGTLRTPSLDYVLPGVTRDSILAIAKHDGRRAVEGAIRPEELFAASEVFLTATSAGVWPVISIDGKPIGQGAHLGKTGPVSAALRARFHDVTSGHVADFDAWLCYVSER